MPLTWLTINLGNQELGASAGAGNSEDSRIGEKICQRAEYRKQRGEEDSQIAGQAEKLR